MRSSELRSIWLQSSTSGMYSVARMPASLRTTFMLTTPRAPSTDARQITMAKPRLIFAPSFMFFSMFRSLQAAARRRP
jgi:hypothetical protein